MRWIGIITKKETKTPLKYIKKALIKYSGGQEVMLGISILVIIFLKNNMLKMITIVADVNRKIVVSTNILKKAGWMLIK
ncbi:MAG: hypothetical protein RIB63_13105 [Fulvivirga sp.]